MTLLDLIRETRQARERKPTAQRRYPQAWHCPINQAQCGHTCFLRNACHTQPHKITALLEQVDHDLTLAIARTIRETQA